MRVYETPYFRELMDQYGLREKVDSFNRRIGSQATRFEVAAMFDKHSGYCKARTENNNLDLRLMGRVITVFDDEIFVWFTIFERRDPMYDDFSKLVEQNSERITRSFDKSAVEDWYQRQEDKAMRHAKPKPLPDDMHMWLQPLHQSLVTNADGQELFVYESDFWVRNILSVGQNDLSSFRRSVEKIVETCESDREYGTTGPFTVFRGNDDGTGGVVFKKMDASNILLIAPLKNSKSFDESDIPPVAKDWKKSARRGYPAYVSIDSEMWIDVQNETRANLALSPEEEELLAQVAGRSGTAQILPLFINGSAGSGKSTMLAYIFAGLCRQKQGFGGEPLNGIPMFLTYSEALVDEARRMTDRLLSKNVYLQQELTFTTDELFQNWRNFLVSLLPDNNRLRYRDDRRVGFHQFKLAYSGRPDRLKPFVTKNRKSGISAELAWYVIRSLIKGSAPAGANELTLTDYQDMNRQDRVVSDEMFETVLRTIYQAWYAPSMREQNLWDDQDLVAEVLSSPAVDSDRAEVTALVIDEAQDFTRRELSLVARSSAFRNYKLREGAKVALPIIFAGDPMQSLSPTGFRWDAVKATIYEELQAICDNAAMPTFEQLRNNYRSTAQIVGFANAIQVLRMVKFGIPKTPLQKAWDDVTDSVAPRKFILGSSNLSEQSFVEEARQTVIIVPCEEGGEVFFVQNDPTLAKMYPNVSDSDPAGNVYSAAGAKGLEFEKVILYKFGEAAPSASRTAESDERDLTAEYFFNKLYVAATRATKFLNIVDTDNGNDLLWASIGVDAVSSLTAGFTQTELRTLGLTAMPDDGADADVASVIGLEESFGGIDDKVLLREDQPLRYAESVRNHGIDTRNPLLLRQAKSFYRQLGHAESASLCEAFALKFEGSREEAAQEFVNASNFGEAFECLWAAGAWDQLNGDFARHLPSLGLNPSQTHAMTFMSSDRKDIESLGTLVHALWSGKSNLPRPSQDQWETIVEELLKSALSHGENLGLSLAGTTAELAQELSRAGFVGCMAAAAELFMTSGQLAAAERIWTQNGIAIPERHARSFAAKDGYPSGLRYLRAANLHDEVLKIWREASSPTDPGWVIEVRASLDALDDYSGLAELLLTLNSPTDAGRVLLDRAASHRISDDLFQAVAAGFASELRLAEGIAYINSVVALRTGTGRTTFESVFIKATVEAAIAGGWLALQESQRSPWLALLQSTSTWSAREKVRVPELVWGAAYELARDFKSANSVYEKLVETQNQFIRKHARVRYLECQREMRRPGIMEKARQWKLDPKRLARVPVVDPSAPTRKSAAGQVPSSHGSHDNLSWMVMNDTVLQVTVMGDPVVMGLVDLVDFTVKFPMAGFEVILEDETTATIVVADWSVVVDRVSATLTATDPFGRSYEDVMALKFPGKPSSSVNRSSDPETEIVEIKSMLVSEFKKVHNLKTVEFDRLSRRAEVKRKGAAVKLAADEVERLLKQMEKERELRDKRQAANTVEEIKE
jgi:hypothetical protein